MMINVKITNGFYYFFNRGHTVDPKDEKKPVALLANVDSSPASGPEKRIARSRSARQEIHHVIQN